MARKIHSGVLGTASAGGNPWVVQSSGTVVNNDRIFVDTSGGAGTITLPASPLIGDAVRFLDYASTFDTNNFTIGRNGKKINNLNEDLIVSTEDSAIGLVFTGDTYGWKLIEVL